MRDSNNDYGKYEKSLALRFKDSFRKILKSSRLGQKVYPFFQRYWRMYIIPKRQKLLQEQGPAALGRLHKLLSGAGVPYYADFGTLIGFVRDGGFIKHDDDIDISIPIGARKPVDVLKVFMDAGYGYIHGFDFNGELLEFTVADMSGLSIDVFFPTKMNEPGMLHGHQPIWDPKKHYPSETANTVVQYDFVAPKGTMEFDVVGQRVMIPANYDEVLTSEYGPWKVPDAKFNTVTDRVHRELPGFAFRVTKEEALAM